MYFYLCKTEKIVSLLHANSVYDELGEFYSFQLLIIISFSRLSFFTVILNMPVILRLTFLKKRSTEKFN